MPVRSHIGWLTLAALAIALAAALVFPVFHSSLGADDLRTEWRFEGEDALDGWISIDTALSKAALGIAPGEGAEGSRAASITIDTFSSNATVEVWYPLVIQSGATYDFGGKFVSLDGEIHWARLEIVYFDETGDQLGMQRAHLISPGPWETKPLSSWCDATQGRLRVLVFGDANAIAYIDDLYVKVTAPTTPCPTPIPTTTSTHTPSATSTPPATASPTATPTNTSPPSNTTSPADTLTPAPTSTRTDTPTAVATAASVSPELRFTNGGFEEGAGGAPAAWQTIGGLLMQSGSPVHGGSWSGAFFSSTSSTKWAYQTVSVEPANWYTFAAYVYHDDPWVESAALRISWYASTDGTGSALATIDSTGTLAPPKPEFRPLTTGPVMAPPGVGSARLRVLMRPVDNTNAVIYIDDASFVKADAPLPSTSTQTSTPQTTSTVTTTTAPGNTPGATTSQPAPTSTPSPTETDTPIPTSTAFASPTPASPSSTLAQAAAPLRLTNAGFEIEEEGAPAGWQTFGGLLTQTNTPIRSGAGAGAFFSSSSSTKWLYQTVAIRPQAWYRLDAFVHHSHAWVESVLLRISWYGSDDGSGSAMLSVDSTASLDLPAPGYRQLTTGQVQAPPGARSAKLRILLRPRDGTSALIYIDDVSFSPIAGPAFVEETAAVSAAPATSGRISQVLSTFVTVPATATNGQQPSYTPMPAPVIRRHTLRTPEQFATPREGDSLWPWVLLGATVGAGAVGWGAYWALRRERDVVH